MPTTRRVVLIGAGHAHLHSLSHAEAFARRGVELIVIAPENFWYSGLATGVLGGCYPPELDQVGIAALMRSGRFVQDRVVKIFPGERSVQLGSGEVIAFDVLSINIGSEVQPIAGETQRVFPIKPLRELWRLRCELERERDAAREVRIVVAGGGASGCEIAANIRALMDKAPARITLLARGERVATGFPPRVSAQLLAWLRGRGVEVRLETELQRIEELVARTSHGEALPFDYLVNATGLRPPALLAESGLPCSARGELLVDEHLRSLSGDPIFGGGDCIKLRDRDVEKIGVYAVRESPVLLENILAALDGEPPSVFLPQRHCLLIMNLGDGVGLAHWRGLHWLGRAAFWLKDRIDRRFLARYQR